MALGFRVSSGVSLLPVLLLLPLCLWGAPLLPLLHTSYCFGSPGVPDVCTEKWAGLGTTSLTDGATVGANSAWARAAYGHLGVAASASDSWQTAYAWVRDALKVDGGPAGRPGVLEFDLRLSAAYSTTYGSYNFTVDVWFNESGVWSYYCSHLHHNIPGCWDHESGGWSASTTRQVPIIWGGDNWFNITYAAAAHAGDGIGWPGGQSVNAFNSFGIVGLRAFDEFGNEVPGFIITAQSGHDYNPHPQSPPVPEPGTGLLAGGALLLCAMQAAKRMKPGACRNRTNG